MLHEFENMLRWYGGPPTLYFGASHVRHLKDFLKSPKLKQSYRDAFSRSEFVSVGESTWKMILKHIKGEKTLHSKQGPRKPMAGIFRQKA